MNRDILPVWGEMEGKMWDGIDEQSFWMDLVDEWDIGGFGMMDGML